MPVFSRRSKLALKNAHPLLVTLCTEAIKEYDFVITESRRNKADQEKAKAGGFSNASYGQSPHNYTPALALDLYPYPIIWDRPDYKDGQAFIRMSEFIIPLAKQLKIPIRWGGDWDGDGSRTDQKLHDLPHYELTPWQDFAKFATLYKGA